MTLQSVCYFQFSLQICILQNHCKKHSFWKLTCIAGASQVQTGLGSSSRPFANIICRLDKGSLKNKTRHFKGIIIMHQHGNKTLGHIFHFPLWFSLTGIFAKSANAMKNTQVPRAFIYMKFWKFPQHSSASKYEICALLPRIPVHILTNVYLYRPQYAAETHQERRQGTTAVF